MTPQSAKIAAALAKPGLSGPPQGSQGMTGPQGPDQGQDPSQSPDDEGGDQLQQQLSQMQPEDLIHIITQLSQMDPQVEDLIEQMLGGGGQGASGPQAGAPAQPGQ